MSTLNISDSLLKKFSGFVKKNKLPKTVLESIPYEQVYDNGVIETEPGTFTRAYLLKLLRKNSSLQYSVPMECF